MAFPFWRGAGDVIRVEEYPEGPQAWAAAAPLQLLITLLRITPQPSAGHLWCAPAMPGHYLPLRVTGLRLGQSHLAIDIRRDGWDLTGLDGTGIELVREPRTYHHTAAS